MRGFPLNEIQEPARALENHGPSVRRLDAASVPTLDNGQGAPLDTFRYDFVGFLDRRSDIIRIMSEIDQKQNLDDHLRPARAPNADPDYIAWKDAKIRKALEQAEDRSNMIPASKVWEQFGLER